MLQGSHKWLAHLEKSIPQGAYGYSISMYSVALEGWRRGMKLKFINRNRKKAHVNYSLEYKGKKHEFTVARGDKTTRKAVKTCINKHKTKEYLLKADVPTPKGVLFKKETSDNEITEYARQLGYPVVIKPVAGTGGAGVVANIQNEEEFKEALFYVKYELKNDELIVEKHFDGQGYRIHVIGDQVVGAFDRIAANVVGDGENTIEELLRLKLKERDKNPALFRRPIKIDRETKKLLNEKGYSVTSIPDKGERVILKSANNVSSGGDSIDVTDKLSKEIEVIAINAVKAIPGLEHAGIDMIIDEEANTGVVLEINSRPSIRNHLFPNEGIARDIPKAIIDFYFPETRMNDYKSKPLFYFDYQSIFDMFQQGKAKEIVIPNVPTGNIVAKTFIVTGDIQKESYSKWIKKKAQKLKLNGYVKSLQSNKLSIIVSGNVESINQIAADVKNKSPNGTKVEKVIENKRTTPVQMGFTMVNVTGTENVADGYYPVQLKGDGSSFTSLKKQANNTRKNVNMQSEKQILKNSVQDKKSKIKNQYNIEELTRERDYYKREYDKVINSNSWKITKLFRKTKKIFNNN